MNALKRKGTKRAMLSRMYKRDMDKIATDIGIPKNKTKAELLTELVKNLSLDDVRKYYSEIFGSENSNILKHRLVPEHKILNEEEREEIIKKYRMRSPTQLPKIKVFDPSVIAVGGVIGDVIQITRKSSIAGEIKYYRLVVR